MSFLCLKQPYGSLLHIFDNGEISSLLTGLSAFSIISIVSGSCLKQQKKKSLNLYHTTWFQGKLAVLVGLFATFASRVPKSNSEF